MAIRGRPQRPHFTTRQRGNLNWQELAACVDVNPAIFFTPDRYNDALTVCAACPVKTPCSELGDGMEGVWGGRIHQRRRYDK